MRDLSEEEALSRLRAQDPTALHWLIGQYNRYVASIIRAVLGKTCPDASLLVLDAFSDKDKIADYAKGHTATLVAQGVVSGKGTGIDPKGNLTRAEMAVILHRALTL